MADVPKLRAWWFERQGLMQPQRGESAASVLARTGWARSVGGANPYLTLFSRCGTSREQADADLADQEIHELPSARGCTYVLPRQDYALGLLVGQGFGDEAQIATARKFLGVTEAEIEALMERVLAALSAGQLDPRQLRDAVGDAVRNLGAEGKKRGLTTTLPLALGRLQSHGFIRRIPVSGRLDQQRYAYARWSPSPLEGFEMPRSEAFTELAGRYFRWTGPASLAHFQWFSGLGVKASKEAIAPLGMVPLEAGSDLLLHPEDLDAFHTYQVPPEPVYALVASIDGLTLLRRDSALLLDEDDLARTVPGTKGLVDLRGLQDVPNHAIFDRGRLIGLWEYDPFAGEIVWASMVPITEALRTAVARTESFCREQLGDVRSFSLDSPESRRPQLEALRTLAREWQPV